MAKVNDAKFTVILREEDTGYSAHIVELPGCISQGKTKRNAIANIKAALEGYLEAFPEN